jgi:hypothetical protein
LTDGTDGGATDIFVSKLRVAIQLQKYATILKIIFLLECKMQYGGLANIFFLF